MMHGEAEISIIESKRENENESDAARGVAMSDIDLSDLQSNRALKLNSKAAYSNQPMSGQQKPYQPVKKHPLTSKQPIRRQTSNTVIGGARNRDIVKQQVLSFADQDRHLVIPGMMEEEEEKSVNGLELLENPKRDQRDNILASLNKRKNDGKLVTQKRPSSLLGPESGSGKSGNRAIGSQFSFSVSKPGQSDMIFK